MLTIFLQGRFKKSKLMVEDAETFFAVRIKNHGKRPG
jgi:hypothetical protein